MIDEKEKTALATSVGADERQSIQPYNDAIIATGNTEINHPDENFDEIYRQFQRMNDPAYLHTVSMNDLYETVFMSRPPVIDGLLYSGTYLFAGAPKQPPDPLLDKIAAVITEENPAWNGSATELVALLSEDLQPNILTRRLNVKAGELRSEYGIEYTMKRTRNGSAISLVRKAL